jgi:hypothetical protein
VLTWLKGLTDSKCRDEKASSSRRRSPTPEKRLSGDKLQQRRVTAVEVEDPRSKGKERRRPTEESAEDSTVWRPKYVHQ